jgi:KDO2-lipid IV(A) lauroyltransferase
MSDSLLHPRYWLTWLGLGLLRCIVFLPFSTQQSIGRFLGRLLNKILKRRRHNAEVNIALCFPELSSDEQKRLVDANMISTTLGAIETAFSWWASDKAILKRSKIEGLELLEQAKQEGRGVLLIGAHYTTLDLAGRVIGMHTDLDITYKDQHNKAFDYCINQARKHSFTHLIEKNAMRNMVKNLKKQRVVWYAPDQDFGRQGAVFVPFFHRPAATLTTVGKLLSITHAKPLFYSHFRIDNNGDTFYLAKIHDPFKNGFNDDDIHNATLLNKAIEDVIREHPEQYLWVHERFRTQPNLGEPKPYTLRKKKKAPTDL